MEKVITLLKSLSQKVTTDGKMEAAEYDKYACFCHDQATDKQHSIARSDEKIASLSAEIKELDTSIAELNSEVSKLTRYIRELEGRIDSITRRRNRDHDKYSAQAKDMNEAIDSCVAAIEALKTSKSDMTGAKLTNLVQASSKVAVAPGTVALISELKQAPKFQFQSNDIIATIEKLEATFRGLKQKLDLEEADSNHAFEAERQGLANEKKFKEEERAEKEAIVEDKNDKVNGAREDKEAEMKDRNADDTFLDELTVDCKEKALLFDQRSRMRADEVRTLAEATETLQNGALEENKKLIALSDKSKVQKKVADLAVKAVVKKAAVRPVSFLQAKSSEQEEEGSGRQKAVEKVVFRLSGAAARIGSTILTNAAMHAKMSEDHFVKVRTLIKNLLVKLKEDAKNEASRKGFCDTGMKKAISDRDEASARIEMANAKITSFTAKQASLEDDIANLNEGIAELKKGVYESTQLQAEDQARLAKVENMSEDAIDSVKQALSLLNKFYSNAFLQSEKYVPPNADRDGNTMDAMAPKVFEKKYHAAQQESQGIIGILSVIVSDFERIKQKTIENEASSKAQFEKLLDADSGDIALKQKEIKKKEAQVSDTKSDIIDQQQALADAKDLLESGDSSLESLKSMCVKGEETWQERKKKREEEIDALKDSLDILNNWQS